MKTENASAGAELEKTVNSIKDKLRRPFGEVQKQDTFDPLNLQKDIPDKKKPDALNFLAKGKAPAKGVDDLLDLGLAQSPAPTATTPSDSQKTSKSNGLNFLNKKAEPKKAAPTEVSNLLDLDLIGGTATPVTTNVPTITQQSNGGNLDLFDLQVNSTPTQTNMTTSFNTPMNTGADNMSNLLDLTAFAPAPAAPKPGVKKPATKEELFDFGL